MSMLAKRVQQEAKRGISAIIYGQNGAGKSNLAGSLKNTLYVASERGFTNLDLNNNYVVEIDSFMDLLTLFSEVSESIANGTNAFETIVLDSISSLERQLHKYIISTDAKKANDPSTTMLNVLSGYGSAYSIATKHWCDVLDWCQYFLSNGINVIATAHSYNSLERDTEFGLEYNFVDILCYSPKSSKAIGAKEVWSQTVDLIGYLHLDKPDKDSNERKRVLSCYINDRWHAKNRFHINDDIVIPRDNAWNALADAILECSGKDYRTT
jgi:hypothetical protein